MTVKITEDIDVMRSANSTVFHIPGPRYIALGEMLCGRRLSMAGFIAKRNSLPHNRSMCVDCENSAKKVNNA